MATTLIAQLSDTHVVAPSTDETMYCDNNGNLAEAVASINAESPAVAAVIATGDLTQWGSEDESATLAEILKPLRPRLLPISGNHDIRGHLKAVFPDHPWVDADHASWVVDVEGVRVVGLDSTIPGESGAEFDDERETWLRATLAEPHAGPTILAMHHPPFRTGIEWMDKTGFLGLDRLAALLGEHPVDRIVCGHLHRPISSVIAGVPAEVGLSTGVHVALSLGPDGPVEVIRDPPGYRLHLINQTAEASTIVSHTRFVTGEDSFAPHWASDI